MTQPREKEYPFYLKTTVILFGLVLLVYIFSGLGDILVPLAFAAFIAILLNPLVNRLQKRKVPKVLAIILSLLCAILFLVGLFYFLSSQISQFSEAFPLLKQKIPDPKPGPGPVDLPKVQYPYRKTGAICKAGFRQ